MREEMTLFERLTDNVITQELAIILNNAKNLIPEVAWLFSIIGRLGNWRPGKK